MLRPPNPRRSMLNLVREQAGSLRDTYGYSPRCCRRRRQQLQSGICRGDLHARSRFLGAGVWWRASKALGFKVFNQDVANAPSLEDSVRFHAFPRPILPPTALREAPKAAQTMQSGQPGPGYSFGHDSIRLGTANHCKKQDMIELLFCHVKSRRTLSQSLLASRSSAGTCVSPLPDWRSMGFGRRGI